MNHDSRMIHDPVIFQLHRETLSREIHSSFGSGGCEFLRSQPVDSNRFTHLMPGGYMPRLEIMERECWKFLDWRLNSD